MFYKSDYLVKTNIFLRKNKRACRMFLFRMFFIGFQCSESPNPWSQLDQKNNTLCLYSLHVFRTRDTYFLHGRRRLHVSDFRSLDVSPAIATATATAAAIVHINGRQPPRRQQTLREKYV